MARGFRQTSASRAAARSHHRPPSQGIAPISLSDRKPLTAASRGRRTPDPHRTRGSGSLVYGPGVHCGDRLTGRASHRRADPSSQRRAHRGGSESTAISNVNRDRAVAEKLGASGWRILRIWKAIPIWMQKKSPRGDPQGAALPQTEGLFIGAFERLHPQYRTSGGTDSPNPSTGESGERPRARSAPRFQVSL